MAVAERFSKTTLMSDLTSTQMIQLLSLPSAEETEKFIEQKAALINGKSQHSTGCREKKLVKTCLLRGHVEKC